jgi:hypothetical protein
MPAKFSSLFSLGSVAIIIALSFLKGPEKLIKELLVKEKL